jgi:hypothetical protein
MYQDLREEILNDLNDYLSPKFGWITNIEEPLEEYRGPADVPRHVSPHFDFSEQLIVTLMMVFWANLFSGIIFKWFDTQTSSIIIRKNLKRADEELGHWMDITSQRLPDPNLTPEVAQVRTRLLKRLEILRENDPMLIALLPKWEHDLFQTLRKHGWPEEVAAEDARHTLYSMLRRSQEYSKDLIQGDYVMGDKKIEILVEDATISGDFVVADSIKDSFNKLVSSNAPNELKDLLKDLSIAVGKMIEALPKDEGKRVARALDTLIDEATSEKPQRRWWEVSIEGVTKAAKSVGEIGKPVLELVGKIVPLLARISS